MDNSRNVFPHWLVANQRTSHRPKRGASRKVGMTTQGETKEAQQKASVDSTKGLPYIFPNDSDEVDRLIGQHYLVKEIFGSLFRAPVENLLTSEAKVLDVGCGPGTWTMEMATNYPCQFWGIDISDNFPSSIKPINTSFAVCDVTKNLSIFQDNTFDYIFQRFMAVSYAKDDWILVTKELNRILKPGGYLEVWEMDLELQRTGPESTAILAKTLAAFGKRGLDPIVARRLPSIFAVSGFTSTQSIYRSVPVGWGDSVISKLQSQLNQETLQSLKPFLIRTLGMNPEEYDALAERGQKECIEYQTYINYVIVYGRKAT